MWIQSNKIYIAMIKASDITFLVSYLLAVTFLLIYSVTNSELSRELLILSLGSLFGNFLTTIIKLLRKRKVREQRWKNSILYIGTTLFDICTSSNFCQEWTFESIVSSIVRNDGRIYIRKFNRNINKQIEHESNLSISMVSRIVGVLRK